MKKIIPYLFLCLFSCSEEKSPEQEIHIAFEGPEELDLRDTGLSSYLMKSYKMTGTPLNNGVLVFNNYYDRIDTLFFQENLSYAKKGKGIQKEGPRGIDNFRWFDSSSEGFIFYSQNDVHIEDSSELKRVNLLNDPLFGNDNTHQIIQDFSFNNFANYYLDLETSSYFLTKNFINEEISFFRLNHADYRLEKVNVPFKRKLLEDHTVSYSAGRAKVYRPNTPHVLMDSTNRIIVSYPFTNLIQVGNILTNDFSEYEFETFNYPYQKKLPLAVSGLISKKDADEMGSLWSNDVLFAPIYALGKRNYVRIVRGPKQAGEESAFYLEVYDADFKKLKELSLNDFTDDLDKFHLIVGDEIIIKAKNQPNEDRFKFYRLKLTIP